MIRIAYTNFWRDPRNDRWLSQFINKTIECVTEVSIHDDPDILVGSCFGPMNKSLKHCKARCKIFFTGENPERYKPYDDFDLVRDYYDLIVGFRPSYKDTDVVRFPHWLIYYPTYDINDNENIIDTIEQQYSMNKQNKTLFATIVARRNDAKVSRDIILEEVSKHGIVSAPQGLLGGNTHSIGSTYQDKLNFIKQSIYNVCPENSSYPGYCTEKIFHAAQAGCIPVYWGHDRPESGIINTNKYCFADIHNKQEMHRSVVDCVNNPEKYLQGDFFTKDAKEHVQQMYTNLTTSISILLK